MCCAIPVCITAGFKESIFWPFLIAMALGIPSSKIEIGALHVQILEPGHSQHLYPCLRHSFAAVRRYWIIPCHSKFVSFATLGCNTFIEEISLPSMLILQHTMKLSNIVLTTFAMTFHSLNLFPSHLTYFVCHNIFLLTCSYEPDKI